MSTILDALRKAAERHPAEPATPAVAQPPTAVQSEDGTGANPPVERPGPTPPAARAAPADLETPKALEATQVAATTPAEFSPAPVRNDLSTTPALQPETPAPQWIDLPPPGDFPAADEQSFFPADDDGAAWRKKLLHAGVVITIGIVLGLLVGRRFLPESGGGVDDLLSDAVLSKSVKKADDAPPLKPTETPPAKAAAGSASAKPGSGENAAAASEKSRGVRAEKPRREAEKSSAKNTGDAAKPPTPTPQKRSSEPTLAPSEVSPPFSASPQPPQAQPKPATPSQAVESKPAATPGALEPNPPPAPDGIAALAPGARLPSPAPPRAAVPPTPPPLPVPVSLPPPPDDAPAFALLFVQWSSEPARRVASLRQSSGGTIYIVHEGDIVQGLRIAGIRPTGIEVEWREQSFLLPASRH